MQNDSNKFQIEEESWLNCIGELINKSYFVSTEEQSLFEDPIFLDTSNSSSTNKKNNLSSVKISIQTEPNSTIEYQQSSLKEMAQQNIQTQLHENLTRAFKDSEEVHNEEQSSKQESKDSGKQGKYGKQSQYSKSYREKKKQQLKTLQEQNTYLKQKINELQNRLREKELQINRLKHPPSEKQCSVEQLNEEFIKKTNLMLLKTTIDPLNYAKTIYSPEDKFYSEFMNSYEEHGFGGRRKKNTLNYYFNELLESVIRDSEKYLFLICNNCKDPSKIVGLETYEQIDLIFDEIMQLDEDKTERIKFFTINLHSFMKELKQICHDLCTDFNRILNFLEKVHNFMKASYPNNMDFARKRIELENWFQHNKHSKLIRRLRFQWLESIKQATQDEHEQKSSLKGRKKKKNPQQKQNL